MTELGFPVSVVESLEKQGRWPDLTRLADRKPEVLKGIVWMLAHDVPVKQIEKALGVSPCTINAVRHHPVHGAAVVSKSSDINKDLEFVIMAKARELRELAMDGKLPNMFDTKLIFDILQLRTGGATQRVEVIESPAEREASEFFEQARREPSGMVFEAEILPEKAASTSVAILPPPVVHANTLDAKPD
jgi:hypothetical protein